VQQDGEPHIVPLTGRSLDTVQRAYADRREGCLYLFHSVRCGTWTHRHHAGEQCTGRLAFEWETACKKAGVLVGRKNGGYVSHNTRHSAVTNMNGAGIPDSVATTLSGLRTLGVFKRYGIRQESVQRAAQEKVEEYLRNLTTDPEQERKVS
jgi:integrase